MHSYYLVYAYGEYRFGSECVSRESPIDNEEALSEEHQRLEETFGAPVVILDWKRID